MHPLSSHVRGLIPERSPTYGDAVMGEVADELDRQSAEIAALTAECERLRAVFAYVVTIKDHTARQEAARQALETHPND